MIAVTFYPQIRILGVMKIDSNSPIDPARYAAAVHAPPPVAGGREAMAGAALSVCESPSGGEVKVSSAMEASLDRNDSVGRLFQLAFNYQPPEMPAALLAE